MAIVIPVGCAGGDDGNSSKIDPPPGPGFVDTKAPTITVALSDVDITGVEKILISGSELRVGDVLVASWTDDVTKSCKVQMSFDGSAVSSGEVATHA